MEYTNLGDITGKMKAYSIDFQEKIVKAYAQGNTSIRKVASRFDVSKALVQKLLKQQKIQGHVQPGKQGGTIKSELDGYETQLALMVEKDPDATLSEYCEYWISPKIKASPVNNKLLHKTFPEINHPADQLGLFVVVGDL